MREGQRLEIPSWQVAKDWPRSCKAAFRHLSTTVHSAMFVSSFNSTRQWFAKLRLLIHDKARRCNRSWIALPQVCFSNCTVEYKSFLQHDLQGHDFVAAMRAHGSMNGARWTFQHHLIRLSQVQNAPTQWYAGPFVFLHDELAIRFSAGLWYALWTFVFCQGTHQSPKPVLGPHQCLRYYGSANSQSCLTRACLDIYRSSLSISKYYCV